MINPAKVIFTQLPSLPIRYADALPHSPALYFCFSESKLLYIGVTTNLHNRWNDGHHKIIQLLQYPGVSIHWLEIDRSAVSTELERQFIDYWQPLLNGRTEKPYWGFVNSDAWRLMAKDKDLTWQALRVRDFLFSCLDFENWIPVPQIEVAQELDMSKQNINRAIKLLVEKQIILKGQKSGHSYTFRLNPHYGWKGRIKNLQRIK
jgi:hypothetical protein